MRFTTILGLATLASALRISPRPLLEVRQTLTIDQIVASIDDEIKRMYNFEQQLPKDIEAALSAKWGDGDIDHMNELLKKYFDAFSAIAGRLEDIKDLAKSVANKST